MLSLHKHEKKNANGSYDGSAGRRRYRPGQGYKRKKKEKYFLPSRPMVFQCKKETCSQGKENAHLNAKLPGVSEPPGAASGSNGYIIKIFGPPFKERELSHLEAVQKKGQHEDEKAFFGIDDIDDQKKYDHPCHEIRHLLVRNIGVQGKDRGKK